MTVKNANESDINSTKNTDNSKTVSCKVIKLNEDANDYTLQCNSPDEKLLDLNGAFSELGNENLIVNFLDYSDNSLNLSKIDSEDKAIDTEDKEIDKVTEYLKVYNRKNSGLSAGAIVAIVVSCVAAVIIAAIATVLLRKSPKGTIQDQSKTNINVSNITSNQ